MLHRAVFMVFMAVVGSVSTAFPAGSETPVFVSILPQKYFVERIGGDLVDVHVMVPPGAGPATYEPKPRQMAALSQARIYFAVGVPFERAWLDRIAAANPGMRIVHTDAGIQKIPMAAHHHEGDHGKTPDARGRHPEVHGSDRAPETDPHQHETGTSLDPHVWLSPPLVKIQARHILEALSTADPGNASVYAANYRAFLEEIEALHQELLAVFKDRQGEAFMVFHPSWGYFAAAYGLRQIAIELEGKAPKPAQVMDLIATARTAGVKVIFVQPQFSTKSARVIANAVQGEIAIADPLAENWPQNLRTQAQKFQQTLKP